MTDLAAFKARAAAAIDAAAPRLFEVSENLHANVELYFQEYKGQRWLCDLLKEFDFAVEEGLGTLPTAFRGTANSGKPGPRIAFLSEYDGLPVYGHSCGHNVGGPASIGAAIGLKSVISELGGEVISLGTPGEEGGSGKHVMYREGYFADIDAMMLIYPGGQHRPFASSDGDKCHVRVFRQGCPRRGSTGARRQRPGRGDAGFQRDRFPASADTIRRPHSLHDHQGWNVAQRDTRSYTAILMIRANDNATLDLMIPRIDAILGGAAMMTGARLEKNWRDGSRGTPSSATMRWAASSNKT